MGLYLIKSGLCLAITLGIYHLLLEKEKMHQFNRFFLLFGLGFSFVVPLLETNFSLGIDYNLILTDTPWTEGDQSDETMVIISEAATAPVTPPVSSFNFLSVILFIYFSISGLLLIRFIRNVTIILQKAINNERVSLEENQLVLVKEDILPHTFWNFIFVNEATYKNNIIETELFTHELTHARERHSFDIILVEVLQVLFWFNPFLIPYKRAIQLNHEFLADDQVIKSHRRVRDYQELLLDKATQSKVYLASNLNFLVTKKRLTMMTKNTSRRKSYCLAASLLPFFACLLLVFSCKTGIQDIDQEWTEKEMQEQKEAYLQNTTIVRDGNNGLTYYKPYENMTEEEKAAVPMPPPPPKPSGQIKEIPLTPLPPGTLLKINSAGEVLLDFDETVIAPPPPPPPPPSGLMNVREVAKAGKATFYLNNKKISTEKALEMIGEKGEGWKVQGSIDPEGFGIFHMVEIE